MKKFNRLLSFVALPLAIATFSSCGQQTETANIKVGLILLHPASSSTYDKNFYDSMLAAKEKLGFDLIVKENIPESDECERTAKQLAEEGCDIVFADSFGHEDYMISAAKEYPDVEFFHATGTKAKIESEKTENPVKNFHNAFASIYEGRYLAGIVAGQRMKEDIEAKKYTAEEAKIGYVGAHPYAEVISGFTSFYLGAKSIVPSVTMEVRYTNSWYDYTAENTTAKQLIDSGCKLISQHADSYGAPNACEEMKVPNVTYNGSTADQCPDTYLISSKIDWQPYYEYIVDAVKNNKEIEADYVGNIETGSVKITEYGKTVSEETKTIVSNAKEKLTKGELHVFDVTKFTVNGETPSNANMTPNKTYTYDYPAGTEFVKDGYYHESYYRSAPYFDVIIDGITSISE